MQERFLHRIRDYGSMSKSYGCFSLSCGVIYWSLMSLFLGVGLLLFSSLVNWKTQDVIHFTFDIRRKMEATLNLGFVSPEKDQSEPLGDYEGQVTALERETEALAVKLDGWIKRIVWCYAFLCTIRGVIG